MEHISMCQFRRARPPALCVYPSFFELNGQRPHTKLWAWQLRINDNNWRSTQRMSFNSILFFLLTCETMNDLLELIFIYLDDLVLFYFEDSRFSDIHCSIPILIGFTNFMHLVPDCFWSGTSVSETSHHHRSWILVDRTWNQWTFCFWINRQRIRFWSHL